MDMMKNMYDEGDDNMKKIIGEAMMKSRDGSNTSGDGPGIGAGAGLSGGDAGMPDMSALGGMPNMPDMSSLLGKGGMGAL